MKDVRYMQTTLSTFSSDIYMYMYMCVCMCVCVCGFPGGGSVCQESTCNARDLGSIPHLGRSPGEGHGNPLQYSFLENPHGQKSLVGYSPWSRKQLDRTDSLNSLTHSLASRSVLVFPSCSVPFLGVCSGLSRGGETRGSLQVLTMLVMDRRYLKDGE